jgi:sugar (pentulose or hexulose) kinase
MNGERSLEWNPELRERWHGRHERHTGAELSRAVAEGVLFNIAQYVEVIERESGFSASEIVLSGNGFRDGFLQSLFASILGRELLNPDTAGLASLRGAAVYAWRALGHDASSSLEKLLASAQRVTPTNDPALTERFARFKELRGHS